MSFNIGSVSSCSSMFWGGIDKIVEFGLRKGGEWIESGAGALTRAYPLIYGIIRNTASNIGLTRPSQQVLTPQRVTHQPQGSRSNPLTGLGQQSPRTSSSPQEAGSLPKKEQSEIEQLVKNLASGLTCRQPIEMTLPQKRECKKILASLQQNEREEIVSQVSDLALQPRRLTGLSMNPTQTVECLNILAKLTSAQRKKIVAQVTSLTVDPGSRSKYLSTLKAFNTEGEREKWFQNLRRELAVKNLPHHEANQVLNKYKTLNDNCDFYGLTRALNNLKIPFQEKLNNLESLSQIPAEKLNDFVSAVNAFSYQEHERSCIIPILVGIDPLQRGGFVTLLPSSDIDNRLKNLKELATVRDQWTRQQICEIASALNRPRSGEEVAPKKRKQQLHSIISLLCKTKVHFNEDTCAFLKGTISRNHDFESRLPILQALLQQPEGAQRDISRTYSNAKWMCEELLGTPIKSWQIVSLIEVAKGISDINSFVKSANSAINPFFNNDARVEIIKSMAELSENERKEANSNIYFWMSAEKRLEIIKASKLPNGRIA